MASPEASIVVRCYNEAEFIGKLLHGIFEQDNQDFEVILVDSGSTDGTLEVARQYPIEEVLHIEPENFSFGRALNYGFDAAEGEFCVAASAHVYPKRTDWLDKLIEKFDGPDVGLVYGKQRGNDRTLFSEQQIFRRWFPDHDIVHQKSPFCNNANGAVRRDVWQEFRYDEELTGLEDIDFGKRIQEAGYEISYASEATIVHVHDESAREIYNRYRREAFALKEIMPDQQFGLVDFATLFARNTLTDLASAAREGELWPAAVTVPYFRFLQFWGTYRGFAQNPPISERLWQRFYYPDRQGYPDRDSWSDPAPSGGETATGESIDYDDCAHEPARGR